MERWNVRKLFSGRNFTWLLLLLILVFNFSIRWRLRELPLERDEGEYAYAGQLILQAIPPYQMAWNMKFPGAYLAYAGLMKVFGESPAGIHDGLILVTSVGIVLVFLIGRRLLNDAGGVLAAALFAQLCALPQTSGLACHVTHFVNVFVSLAVYALLRRENSRPLLWTAVAGLALGSALLMTQQAWFFGAAAGIWLLCRTRSHLAVALRQGAVFTSALILPLVLVALWLDRAGVWDRFYLWTIQYAREYISILPVRTAPVQFIDGVWPMFTQAVTVWWLALIGLPLVFLSGTGRRAAWCGAAWLIAGLVATTPGFYFRPHYFLMVMPGIALLGAAAIETLAGHIGRRTSPTMLRLVTVGLVLVVCGDTVQRNAAVWFFATPTEVSRYVYSLNPFPESAEIARYLTAHTRPQDTIAVIGSEPQIYFLSGRHAATGYLYLYPMMEPQPLADTMRADFIREIETNRPEYVVYVNISASWVSTVDSLRTRSLVQSMMDWWQSYAAKNYALAGEIDILQGVPTAYFWDQQMTNRTSLDPAVIYVFRRN
jgi:hypothetical protein